MHRIDSNGTTVDFFSDGIGAPLEEQEADDFGADRGRNRSSHGFCIASSFSKRNKSTAVCCKRFNCLFCFVCKFGGRINKRWFFFFRAPRISELYAYANTHLASILVYSLLVTTTNCSLIRTPLKLRGYIGFNIYLFGCPYRLRYFPQERGRDLPNQPRI